MDPLEEFDHIVIFNTISPNFKKVCDFKKPHYLEWLNSIAPLISDGLTERLSCIKCICIPLRSNTKLPAIGMKLNSSLQNTSITRGPRSGTEEGQRFRKFWGDKAELRHVDGDLFECVLWDASRNVVLQIIDYVLAKHFHLFAKNDQRPWYQITSNRLNALLTSFAPPKAHFEFPSRASTLHLIRSLDALGNLLRDMNSHLPLNIMGVQAVSAEFRETSAFAPIVTLPENKIKHRRQNKSPWQDVHHVLRPIYVTIHVETSGKWPRDNYEAFLHMKRLFLLRIHELLIPKGIPSRVVDTGMLDIFLNGIILRIGFYQSLEKNLLKRALGLSQPKRVTNSKPATATKPLPLPGAEDQLRRWLLFYEKLPALSQQLANVSRSNLGSFPEACRLAKRWLSAHGFPVIQWPDLALEPAGLVCNTQAQSLGDADLGVLECRLLEPLVELLIVHVGGFTRAVQTASYSAGLEGATDENYLSSSPLAVFLRFLKLLYSFDWVSQPLLVDLNEGFSEGDGVQRADEVVTTFKVTPRGDLPAMVVPTSLDPSGADWTHDAPSASGLQRLQVLAKHSYKLLRAMLVGGARLSDLKAVFRPDLTQMDILVLLKPSVFKTRLLEAIDVDVPSWALKRGGDAGLGAVEDGSGKSPKEPGPVTLEVPHPGAKFWPKGYLCDPVTWLLRRIQKKFSTLDLFECLWDRHSGRWIGLRCRDRLSAAGHGEEASANCLRPCTEATFQCSSSGGGGVVFATPRESTESGEIGLAVDLRAALEFLRLWSVDFVDSITVLQEGRLVEMPGAPLELPTPVVVPVVEEEWEKNEEKKKKKKTTTTTTKQAEPPRGRGQRRAAKRKASRGKPSAVAATVL